MTGVILADQVKGLDWRTRNAVYDCTLHEMAIAEVFQKLETLLAPEEE